MTCEEIARRAEWNRIMAWLKPPSDRVVATPKQRAVNTELLLSCVPCVEHEGGKNGLITLAKGEQSLCPEAVEGRYPDYHSILPKVPSRVSFKVGVDLLLGLLKEFKIAGAEQMEVLWYGDGNRLAWLPRRKPESCWTPCRCH
jgi:hypothetical protein